jgi:hypothetical protein
MKTLNKIIAVVLLLYVGAGAIYGGLLFVIYPDGSGLGMTTEFLENTPFENYFIPGIVLLIFNGILPIVTIVIMFAKSKYFAMLLQLQGLILIIWLTVQLMLNSEFFTPHLHYPLYVAGILMIVCGILWRKIESNYLK